MHAIGGSVLVLAALAVTTFYQGQYMLRWQDVNDDAELAAMAERLEHLPRVFGEWEGEVLADTEETLAGYRKAKVKGHKEMRFRNERTGKVVSVSLVCGHRKHVARHRPDQCMVGAGYEISQEVQSISTTTSDSNMAQSMTAQFRKKNLDGTTVNQRMVWMWSRDGKWIAPPNTQVALSAYPTWYKLYVTTAAIGAKHEEDASTAQDFVKEFVPLANKTLFPAPAANADNEPAA